MIDREYSFDYIKFSTTSESIERDLAESQGVYCGTRWDRKEKSVGRIAH